MSYYTSLICNTYILINIISNIFYDKNYLNLKHTIYMNSKNEVDENIELLLGKFKSIADITVSYDRYDIIIYNYDEIEELTKFIEEKTSIKSWTVLKTNVNQDSELDIL